MKYAKLFEGLGNQYIPLTMLTLGTVINILINWPVISAAVILGGMISGLTSTGLYEMMKNLLSKDRKRTEMGEKVIDVSGYQGAVDWGKVKNAGVDGAILKIIRKDSKTDARFENNWLGCEAAGIPVIGVYHYSYAVTAEKAKSDAQKVVDILAGRKTKVWMDVEDVRLKGLGQKLIDIIRAYDAEYARRRCDLDSGIAADGIVGAATNYVLHWN